MINTNQKKDSKETIKIIKNSVKKRIKLINSLNDLPEHKKQIDNYKKNG